MRKKRKVRRIIIVFVLSGFVFIFSIFLFRNGLAEHFIKKKVLAFGFVQPNLQVRDVSITTVDIRDFKVGNPDKPDLEISSVSADFSPLSVLKGKFRRLVVSGVKINLDQKEGKKEFMLRGFPPLKGINASDREELPIEIKEFTIDSSTILINRLSRQIKVPIDGKITRGKNPGSYHIAFTLIPFGDTILVHADLDANKGDGIFHISSKSIRPGNLLETLNIPTDLLFSGNITFSAEGQLKNWTIPYLEVVASSSDIRTAHSYAHTEGGFDLGLKFSDQFEPFDINLNATFRNLSIQNYRILQPFGVHVKGDAVNHLSFFVSPLKIAEPFGLNIHHIKGIISYSPSQTEVNGIYNLRIPERTLSSFTQDVEMMQPVELQGKFSASLPASMEKPIWEFSGIVDQPFSFKMSSNSLSSFIKDIKVTFSAKGVDKNITASVDLKSQDVKGSMTDYQFFSDKILSKTDIQYHSSGNFQAKGSVNVVSSTITKENGISAKGMDAALFWEWPVSKKSSQTKEKAGSFNINSLNVSGIEIKNISGEIQQIGEGVRFSSMVPFPIGNITMDLSGFCALSDAGVDLGIDFEIPFTTIPSSTALGPLHPNLKGVRASGEIYLNGKISYNNDIQESQAKMIIKRGAISIDPQKLFIDGIEMEMNINNLFELSTPPSQKLQFQQFYWQDIPFSDGAITFGLEDSETVFVEKGEFKWCKGKVFIHSFRYNPNKKGFDLTIYCDRIDFNEVLNNLMGEEIASGDGKLNGIIPLSVREGNLVFNDGYLYSKPGAKGDIRIKNSQRISGGVVLVEEAMKDFQYNSIKVNLNTERDYLNIFVYIDGFPNRKLPLTYDSKKKNFVRQPDSKGSVILKGLLLELRFLDIDIKRLLKTDTLLKFISQRKMKKGG